MSSEDNYERKILKEFVLSLAKTLGNQTNVKPEINEEMCDISSYKDQQIVKTTIEFEKDDKIQTFYTFYPESTYLNIMTDLLGMEIDEFSDDIIDGSAEIMNISYGMLKTKYNDAGDTLPMAIPKFKSVTFEECENIVSNDMICLTYGDRVFWVGFVVSDLEMKKTA